MKKVLLTFTTMLSFILVGFFVIYTINLSLGETTELSEYGLLVLRIMLPTAFFVWLGGVFNLLFLIKQNNNHLLWAAISYTVAMIVVYQIFYFALLQALITWFYYLQARFKKT